ncbi:MAG: CoA-binding protein [Rhodospirillaceae bacterium]|nr:MAG: CoA-binding protein [Rhodospirillaceae bacterium]
MTGSLDRLFRPRSVALIGASTDPKKIGGRPLHFLRKHGFEGEIWPVNPHAVEIEGYRSYPDIDSLPGVPDMAVVLVGPQQAVSATASLARKGCGAAIVLAGGFLETDETGGDRQRELVNSAGDMRLLGPNTIGLLNLTDGITLSASGALDIEDLHPGGVAVISQSGGILGSLLSRAVARGIGLSKLAATGNEADIDVSDVMAFLARDDATSVVALYLETVRNPTAFRNAASRLKDAGKKLVVYKVGRSEIGAEAAASHTGALAGEDRVFDAFFRQCCAIRVDRYDDLIDLPAGLAMMTRPNGKRLAVLTHTGGAAGLVADVCGMAGFDTPAPSLETAARLGDLLQDDGFSPDRNPVDLTLAGLDPEIVYRAIMTLSASGEYDAIIPVVGSSSVGRPYMVADPVIRAAATEDIPIVVYTSPHAPGIVARLNKEGVPAFDTPEACATILARSLPVEPPGPGRSPTLVTPGHPLVASGQLNEFDAKRVFAEFGIPPVGEIAVGSSAGALDAATHFGNQVVVKILSRELLHKSEIGGVRTSVAPQDAGEICDEIARSAEKHGVSTEEGFLIQQHVLDATEMILGFRRDTALGATVLIGAGGTMTELYEDVALCVLPATEPDIRTMITSLKMYPLLDGYRGSAPADMDALVQAVARFAHMCQSFGDRLVDAEINPLFVNDGEIPVRAGDGILILSE